MGRPKKRKVSTGRKPLPEGTARVLFNCRVKPETKARIERRAKEQGINTGLLLDETFAD